MYRNCIPLWWLVEVLCYWETWGNVFCFRALMTKTPTSRAIRHQKGPPVGAKGVAGTSTLGHSVLCHEMLFLASVTATLTPAA